MAQNLKQAFHQAPWRSRFQRVFFILLVLAVAALIAILHLYISAQTYTTKVETQVLLDRRSEIVNQIADLKSQNARVTSFEEMQKRTEELNYQDIGAQVIYKPIHGYSGRQFEYKAPLPQSVEIPPFLKPEYTQSIWEWLFQSGLITGSLAVK